MDGPLAPEPGDGRYFLVGLLAVAVIILGVVVVNHPNVGPVRAINAIFRQQPEPLPATRPMPP